MAIVAILVAILAPSCLIGSSSFLQVMRTTIKSLSFIPFSGFVWQSADVYNIVLDKMLHLIVALPVLSTSPYVYTSNS